MAYWINDVGNNNRPNLKEFYCDLEEDISKLPTNTKKRYTGKRNRQITNFRMFNRFNMFCN